MTENRHELSARALRLVLARLTEDGWEAFDATLNEFEDHPEQLRLALQFLAGITAGVLVLARGQDAAIADVTQNIAEQLDITGGSQR